MFFSHVTLVILLIHDSNIKIHKFFLLKPLLFDYIFEFLEQVDSEADVSSDTSLLTSSVTPPVYKQYGEQNLLTAIKAVLDDGMKQVEACVKYGIPFTTLTRKIRLYKSCGGRLPVTQHKTGNLRSAKVFQYNYDNHKSQLITSVTARAFAAAATAGGGTTTTSRTTTTAATAAG